MEISSFTHVGCIRPKNEDACLVLPPWGEPALSSGVCLFAVADGMGGHAGGKIASSLAVNTAGRWLAQNKVDELQFSVIEDMFAEVNQKVWDYVQSHQELAGMGTTFTAAMFRGEEALVGHIGDSRLYRMRSGEFKQLSCDHTLVAEQVRMGHLSPESAKSHPARHILSRVLGVREFVNIDKMRFELAVGDIYLLCSDGVSGLISDERLADLIVGDRFSSLAKRIVAEANKAGGTDNSTVVAVRIDELPVVSPGRYSWTRFAKVLSHWRQICCE